MATTPDDPTMLRITCSEPEVWLAKFPSTSATASPEPRGLLADQPSVTVEASPDWSEATPEQVMENFELVQKTIRTLETVRLASDLSDGEADMLTRVWHD